MATRKRNKKKGPRHSCRYYGGKRPSPEETLLAESGKEQLHLILMVMCVFLYKNYVVGSDPKKQLFPEEIDDIIMALEKIRNTHVGILNRFFGGEKIFNESVPDEPRQKRFKSLFVNNEGKDTVKDPLSNASEFLKTCQTKECSVVFPNAIDPAKIPKLGGGSELLKQVSLKIRLVVFLEDMIALLNSIVVDKIEKGDYTKANPFLTKLDKRSVKDGTTIKYNSDTVQEIRTKINNDIAAEKNRRKKIIPHTLWHLYEKRSKLYDAILKADNSNAQLEQTTGEAIKMRLNIKNELDASVKALRFIGYGIGSAAVTFGNTVSNMFGRYSPRKTACLDFKGGFFNLTKFGVRIRAFLFSSGITPELRERYSFLLYFNSFVSLYEDNAVGKFDFHNAVSRRQSAENVGNSIYEMFAFLYRMTVKNTGSLAILIGSILACQGLTMAALTTPTKSPYWLMTGNIILLPFIDNPLMPIFRKEDIEKYNRILAHQAGDTLDMKKIASVAENHARLVAAILSQPLAIKFGAKKGNSLQLKYEEKDPELEKIKQATKERKAAEKRQEEEKRQAIKDEKAAGYESGTRETDG
jgi:hypothetical protein